MKRLALITLLPCLLFGNIEKDLKEKIHDCRDICEKLSVTCSQDVYLYYYLLGLENAYTDCLKMILEDKPKCH